MRGEDRKDQIIEAAIKAFAKYGYEKTSIANICDLIGIARGTLYQYFKNKHRLFYELVEIYIHRVKSFMQPYDPSDPFCPSFEEFRYRRLVMFLEEIYNHREVYSIIMRDGITRNPQTHEMVLNLHQIMVDRIHKEYRLANKMKYLSVPDPEFAAVTLYGSLLMIIQRYIIDTDKPISPRILAKKLSALRGEHY